MLILKYMCVHTTLHMHAFKPQQDKHFRQMWAHIAFGASDFGAVSLTCCFTEALRSSYS